MSGVRIAGVAAPTSNAFIVEILEAVTDEVRALGGDAFVHKGTVADVDDGSTAFLIIPHEYYWFNPRPSAEHLRRTISLDVEHPGTNGFEVTARVAQVVGAVFEISSDSVHELARRGVRADLFTIGYSTRWDMWGGEERQRSVDLTYMAAADPERVQALAKLAPDLAGINADLLVPPYEHRTHPRPDFLMGETKWRFLADTNVILNLHRESKTALELIRTVEAMCNGCVVLTEPSTALGAIEPGTHILVAPRESIGREAHEVIADVDRLRAVRRNAYDFCRSELSMRASAERLIAVAEELISSANSAPPAQQVQMPDWREVRPPHVPELAAWVPEPYSLPPAGAALPEDVRQAVRDLAVHRRGRMALNQIDTGASVDAEVDVLVVAHAASGSLKGTLASLASQPLPHNVHVAGIGIPKEPDTAVASYLTCSPETSIGAARNELVERSSAPYLLILEAGDELLDGTLAALVDRLAASPQTDIAYTMAAYGEETVVNLFHPEPARLQKDAYLTRGYLLRRERVEKLGGFATDPAIEAYVDHEFWTRVASNPEATVAHVHQIGLRLAPTDVSKLMPFDPVEAREQLSSSPTSNSAALSRSPTPNGAALPNVSALTGAYDHETNSETRPLASVVMPAYNGARFIRRALDSALAQDGVGGNVEIVVVDDGSTDETAAILAEYGERIRVVRQENRGLSGAVERGLREARGEYIALLDSDDEWPTRRLADHIAGLERDPSTTLVHGDMELIDGDGRVLFPSFLEESRTQWLDGRVLGTLLGHNFVTESALTFHRSLIAAVVPVPESVPYPDWWIAVCAAAIGNIRLVPGVAARYRIHGENMNNGVHDPEELRKIARREIPWRRWLLLALAGEESVTAEQLVVAVDRLREALATLAAATPEWVGDTAGNTLVELRARAAATPAGPGLRRTRALAKALAYEPDDDGLRAELDAAAQQEAQRSPASASTPSLTELLGGSRPLLASLDEVQSRPGLLTDFARSEAAAAGRPLVIVASPGADLDPLKRIVDGDPLLSGDGCKLIVITEPASLPSQRWLASHAEAVPGSVATPERDDSPPPARERDRPDVGARHRPDVGARPISPVTVVSASRTAADDFFRATYLGRSLSRFPPSTVPRVAVRGGNGADDSVPLGLPEIYNSVIEQAADEEILLFIHDDVYLHDWFLPQRLTEALEHWDVVGIAGSANPDPRFPAWGLQFDADLRPLTFQDGIIQSGAVNHHDYGVPAPHMFGPTPMRCQLLDGLFIAVRAGTLRQTGVRFDPQFQFHLYDLDFCRSCTAAGLVLGTWPIAVTHESSGNYNTESFRRFARQYLEKWRPVGAGGAALAGAEAANAAGAAGAAGAAEQVPSDLLGRV